MFFDRKLSVGPPFFNMAFTPFVVALAALLPIGSMLPWKRGDLGRAVQPLGGILMLSMALGALAWAMQTGRSALGPIGVLLAAWVVFGALVDLWQRAGRGGVSSKLGRLTRLPRADWGKVTAHVGFGVTVFAVAAVTAWKTEDIRVVQVGESYRLGPYDILLKDVRDIEGPNYLSTMADLVVTRDGAPVATLNPEKRVYPVAQMPTTEAGIDHSLMRDVYLVIGDRQDDGGWAVRSYIEPFVNFIWIGCFLMAIGGTLSLSDRRYRVAAGARRLPAAMPAE
jgi:cytochrome c-type biogenesis protein CcmF